jgi:phenylacetic acid degradation operon negative regulatory protein
MRARSALFTLFGDIVRPAGGDAWLSTLTGCMSALGFSAEATRTALHRMAAEGWVAPNRVGRYAAYRLTPPGVDRLEEAATRIYRLRAAEWDGRWRLLIGLPAGRDPQLSRALTWMGFGQLSADAWVSPHPHGQRLTRLLDGHPGAVSTVGFVAESAGPPGPGSTTDADQRIVATAWDLAELRQAHAAFVDRWRHAVAGDEPAKVFRTLYEAVDAGAWRFYDQLVAAGPPLPETSNPDAAAPADDSPFARGLDALQIRRSDPIPARSTP